jgi:uncharacterized lipoprotein YajG
MSIDAECQKCISVVKNEYETVVERSAFRYKANTERHFVIFTSGKYGEVTKRYSFYLLSIS